MPILGETVDIPGWPYGPRCMVYFPEYDAWYMAKVKESLDDCVKVPDSCISNALTEVRTITTKYHDIFQIFFFRTQLSFPGWYEDDDV